MESLIDTIGSISNFVWGPPLIVMLVGSGIFMTIRLGVVQMRGFTHGFALLSGKYDDPSHKGHISHFQALSTALSATIGTGNIAGVATAIAAGGPGAVFWMWVTAIFGMSLKFSSATLSVLFRSIDADDGSVRGGPMYYIERGMGKNFKFLAIFFSACTALAAFGIGNAVQSNSVADALTNLTTLQGDRLLAVKLTIGIIISVLVGLVIIGGIKRIGAVAARLVPSMAFLYVASGITIIALNIDKVPEALGLILHHAFHPTAAAGGFIGSTVAFTIRNGVARGVFSNEAGLGTAAMAHGAAKTDLPVREGLVAMLGPFIDTLVICTMTALAIVITGAWSSGQDGAPLTADAFDAALPGVGKYIVSIGLMLFAFTTIIGWYYYGEKGIEYLFGKSAINPYKIAWVIVIPIGATVKLSLVWSAADIANAFMALPNLVAILALSGVLVDQTSKYFKQRKSSSRHIKVDKG